MIFSSVSRVQESGIELDPTALERIGVFDGSVCWGVWVHDHRGLENPRKHLLISPIHPSVWPFLLRMEIKLRDKPGQMAFATQSLVDADLNIQFAESAASGHHHATWNVVAEANDIRHELHDAFTEIQSFPDQARVASNLTLKEFSRQLAAKMFFKASMLPAMVEDAHRRSPSYKAEEIDSGFLHNRIVDKKRFPFFYDPSDMPTAELAEVARNEQPRAVTCRWMQNLAFFAIYGDMRHPMRLEYKRQTRLLKLSENTPRGLARILERQNQPTSLPARAVTSFDTAGLSLRIDIVEPTKTRSRFIKAKINYEIEFQPNSIPGENDTARGLWLGVCKKVAAQDIDMIRMANRTTYRDHGGEAGAFTVVGRSEAPITDDLVEELNHSLRKDCRPVAGVASCEVTPRTSRFQSYTVFVSRRNTMPMFKETDQILRELAKNWGFDLEFVKDEMGKPFDDEIERKVRSADGFLQIVSYSASELSSARTETVLPDLQWLIHEYGIAIGAGKPHVRVFDVSRRGLPEWKRIMSPRGGETAGAYDTNEGGLDAIRDTLEKVFASLALQIDENRHERVR